MSTRSDAEALRALRRSPLERGRTLAAGAVFVLAVLWCLRRIELDPIEVFRGTGRLAWLVSKMVPPSSGGFLGYFAEALGETLAMALLGAAMASAAAFPLSVLGARTTTPSRWARIAARRLFDLLRGVPDLVWALIFVSATGLGPAAGVMALAVSQTGVLGKIFSDALDDVDRGVADAVRAAGGNRLQVWRFGLLPQSSPVLADQSLYYFESNVRSATILGVVGAGGIGFQLADRIRLNDWPQVAFLILLILATVAVIDWVSAAVGRRLIHGRRDDA